MSNTDNDQVILVNEHDDILGYADKIEAHRHGDLHRAFSVCLFHQTADGEWMTLLQKRHPDKYHCGGLWSNSCCSHPREGETVLIAAKRRIQEELGIKVRLSEAGSFIYRAEFDNGLIEHEFDHVLIAVCKELPDLHPAEDEVIDTEWVPVEALLPLEEKEHYTPWMELALSVGFTELEKLY